jgi:hypothetical protein
LPQKQRAPDSETGRPALLCLGATTSTGYFTGFSDTIGSDFYSAVREATFIP